MAKDYAKRSFTTRKQKKKRVHLEFFAFLLLVMVCAGGYWTFFHKKEMLTAENNWYSRLKTLFIHHAAHPLQTAKATPAPQPDLHFDFYNSLPHMQVTLPEMAPATPAPKIHEQKVVPAVASQNLTYILQLGVFNEPTSASQLRLSLLLSGIEAEVIRLNIGHNEIYRVQRGPFTALAEAKKMQHQLEMKGILSVLKKA